MRQVLSVSNENLLKREEREKRKPDAARGI